MSKIIIIIGIIMLSFGVSRIAKAGSISVECRRIDYKCSNDQIVDSIKRLESLNSFARARAFENLNILKENLRTQDAIIALESTEFALIELDDLRKKSKATVSSDLIYLQSAKLLKDLRINRVLNKYREILRRSEGVYLDTSEDLRNVRSSLDL
ncbi:MAG: hypothetical protein V4596_05760 [Bdellovibrionota bacterium]